MGPSVSADISAPCNTFSIGLRCFANVPAVVGSTRFVVWRACCGVGGADSLGSRSVTGAHGWAQESFAVPDCGVVVELGEDREQLGEPLGSRGRAYGLVCTPGLQSLAVV